MRPSILFLSALICAIYPPLSHSTNVIQPFEEDGVERKANFGSERYNKIKKSAAADDTIIGSARQSYRESSKRVVVPGFMSSSQIADIATIVGPANLTASYRIGDTIYFQWVGAPGPREGHRYAVYTPAVVLQSTLNPTDFIIRVQPKRSEDLPKAFRLAGFFYETNGIVRITKVRQGLVEAVIEGLSGQVSLGDKLMPVIPRKENIVPAEGGIQLAAAVISGSPSDRLSTTKNSFIYINRGSRDGIREGRIFQSVETVSVDSSVAGIAPEVSLGEAMVVYVSDSYATAMITKQFDVIRIGSLLRTKQIADPLTHKEPFTNLIPGDSVKGTGDYVEVPNVGDLDVETDPTLPDPLRKSESLPETTPKEPSLSELDALERSMKLNALTPEERNRLSRLSQQEKLEANEDDNSDLDLGTPSPAPVDNSFRKGAPKKPTKKKPAPRANDEEELNQLMMQN